jgi:hypothetical protein
MGGRKASEAPAPTSAAPSEATSGAAAEPLPASPHDQITALEQQIDQASAQLALPAPTPAQIEGAPTQPMGALPSTQDPKCRPAPTDTCKTSCTLSDSICDNADRICKLAESMPGDNWAAGKCAKANTTCEASRTKCCGCQ